MPSRSSLVPRRHLAILVVLSVVSLTVAVAPQSGSGQEQGELPTRLLLRVLPEASEFTPKEGAPPVFRGYRVGAGGERVLVGYAFYTSDLPPEEPGYNDPIQVLVGMDPQGVLTGAVVTHYTESLRRTRGDFLGRGGFQDQFAGKSIGDPFRVRRDVDGISGATITVAAMSLGIRNAARRVAAAYLTPAAGGASDGGGPAGSAPATWRGVVASGLAYQLLAVQRDLALFELSLAPILEPAMGDRLLGAPMFREGLDGFGVEEAEGALFVMGIDGGQWDRFRPPHLAFVQDGDTFRVAVPDVRVLGPPREGLLEGEVRRAWLLRADRGLDIRRPFTTVLDIPPARGAVSLEQPGWPAAAAGRVATSRTHGDTEWPGSRPATAATGTAVPGPSEGVDRAPPSTVSPLPSPRAGAGAPPILSPPDRGGGPQSREPAGEAEAGAGTPATSLPETGASEPAPLATAPTASVSTPATPTPPAPFFDLPGLDLDGGTEESVLARTLARTSWSRFGLVAGLLLLALAAFLGKRRGLRGATLLATVVVLGFTGSFLSVSHIISVLRVGPAAFLNDLPLLLLGLFTLGTTLLWGRVFCGFLCPFGALQDALERIVPRRFRRELPGPIHGKAYLAKYGILGVVLAPSLLGSDLSLFQYFEPFGTVFFLSPSLLLWGIALAILGASAVIPRFYCRYACPLGAALAVGSALSPFRIRRVEQCEHCMVCERKCPTGAIRRERIDFLECVRCNVCEAEFLRKAGVCRHPMDEVRPRLVQLTSSVRRG